MSSTISPIDLEKYAYLFNVNPAYIPPELQEIAIKMGVIKAEEVRNIASEIARETFPVEDE